MVDKTLAQGKHTFKSRSRARLIGALLMVGVAVACLVVAVVSPPPGIAFRIIWAVIWLSFGLFGIRLARLATTGPQRPSSYPRLLPHSKVRRQSNQQD